MKFSMNGFRKQLSADIAELRDLVRDSINMQLHDREDLVEAMNRVITHSNVVNCVYNDNDPDFQDISHIEIDHLDMDGDCEQ